MPPPLPPRPAGGRARRASGDASRALRAAALALLLAGYGAAASGGTEGAATEGTAEEAEEAAAFLEMYQVLDAKCQGLRRGDMRMIRNRHPSLAIRYRLKRHLANKPQAGLVTGLIPPGEEGERLGCELLSGREQRWKVLRAEFAE